MDNLAPRTMPALELIAIRGTQVSDAKAAAMQAMFAAREAAARRRNPGKKVSTHMVLTGPSVPAALASPDPRGDYEKDRTSTIYRSNTR